MRDEQFDEALKNVLKEKAKNCSMSEEKCSAVLDQVHQMNKEEQTMKHVSKKKLVIAVVAMCLMASIVAVAAGRIAYYSTSIDKSKPTFTEFADVKNANRDLGHPVRALEQFENGVKFDTGYISTVDCLDENNNKIDSYPELMLDYTQGKETLFMNVSREDEQAEVKVPVRTEDVNGRTLNYYEDQYLMLPPDEKPSAEDLALEAEGKLYISYGSSKVERQTCYYVNWSEEGMRYQLLSWDYSGQELMNMAREVANAGILE